MKLVSITESGRQGKKWQALFSTNAGNKTVHFGSVGYQDFTSGATEEQKNSYKKRHTNPRENHNKVDSPAALSYHILWGSSKSRLENIKTFKNKFNL